MKFKTKEVLVSESAFKSENGESFEVKYFRLETPSLTNEGQIIYSVCIRKYLKNEPAEAVNINLTDSFEHANFIIHYLAAHDVTPVSAVDVIDGIYDLYFNFERG